MVVLLGVSFLGEVVNWEGESNVLPLGAAVASGHRRARLHPLVDSQKDEPDSALEREDMSRGVALTRSVPC